MKKLLAAMFVALLMVGCGEDKQVHVDRDQEGELSGNVYHNKRVGWTIKIPDGWDIVSKEDVDEVVSGGSNLAVDAGLEVNWRGTKILLTLEKDDSSDSFASLTQSMVVDEDDWIGIVEEQKQGVLSMFRTKGMFPEASEIRRETIDGVVFDVYDINLNPGRSPASQTYYWTLFNGYYLCSILTYTSIDSREELFKAWRGSRFRQ